MTREELKFDWRVSSQGSGMDSRECSGKADFEYSMLYLIIPGSVSSLFWWVSIALFRGSFLMGE
jgi:hypothetical protein